MRVARCFPLALGAEHSLTTLRVAHSGQKPQTLQPSMRVAGVEHGKLKHVPSTGDLLSTHVAVPPSIAAEARRAASDLGTALQVGPGVRPLHVRSQELCCGETRASTASAVPGGQSTCLAATLSVISAWRLHAQTAVQEYSPPGSPRSDFSDRGVRAHPRSLLSLLAKQEAVAVLKQSQRHLAMHIHGADIVIAWLCAGVIRRMEERGANLQPESGEAALRGVAAHRPRSGDHQNRMCVLRACHIMHVHVGNRLTRLDLLSCRVPDILMLQDW